MDRDFPLLEKLLEVFGKNYTGNCPHERNLYLIAVGVLFSNGMDYYNNTVIKFENVDFDKGHLLVEAYDLTKNFRPKKG